ncbi:hypothetical protein P3L10_032900 [Capsicum annuum]
MIENILNAGSFSRTAVNVSVGCETAVSNIVMVVTVLISLEFFSRLLYFTPISILASIIISVLPGLINLSEAKYIWKVDKMDFLACATAFLGVLFVSVEIGLLLAVGISFAKIILNSIQPGKEKLGRLPGSDLFGDVEQYPIASTTRGALIVRVKSSLFCFANANFITGRILNIALKEHGEGAIENRDQDRVKLVILDMSNFLNIDTSSIASLEELNELESNGMQLSLVNPWWDVIHKLKLVNFLKKIEGRVFLTIGETIEACLTSKNMLPI